MWLAVTVWVVIAKILCPAHMNGFDKAAESVNLAS
ncbi:hypothetical protein CRENPOLYSF1_640022 [Crenothrix polyspora]|uniref:Uncharacterized protein n=1 Tax=Crenothrix polyspora TaxID=360316 RepID=A0A1R4HGI3_9GAMM|nr:hypothetical protein CRENPOLYSF1_640022 [Crenothrix polyspora]